MNFFKFLDKLNKNEDSLILYCLLDRIPILVLGEEEIKIDQFLVDLSELVHFRKEYVFYTDFISNSEYNNLILNENLDYNSQRAHIRCPCNASRKAISQIENLSSWIIGMKKPEHKEHVNFLKKIITKKTKKCLFIMVSNESIYVETEGIDLKAIDLTLEQNIFKKISQDTEKAIAKMKRVLSERIKTNQLENDLIKTLLDFEVEKNELKRNIFRKEIQNFYLGSKRAYFILSRLSLLNNVEVNTTIGSRTLLETIDYEGVEINRILSFIYREWGENFFNILENGKKSFIGDKIVSLWG